MVLRWLWRGDAIRGVLNTMGRLQTCVYRVFNTYNRRQISVFPIKCGVVESVVRLRVRVWHRVRVLTSPYSLLSSASSLLFLSRTGCPPWFLRQYRHNSEKRDNGKCSHALRTSTMFCDFTTLNIIYKWRCGWWIHRTLWMCATRSRQPKFMAKQGCQGKKRWRWKGERQEWRRSVFFLFHFFIRCIFIFFQCDP